MINTSLFLKVCACALLLPLLASSTVSAEDPDSAWQPLTDEPSRGQLFQDYASTTTRRPQINTALGSRLKRFSFVFPYMFSFPRDAAQDWNGKLRTDALFGLDISYYEGKNFPVKLLKQQQVSFVYVKATQGTDLRDTEFGTTWAALAALSEGERIPRGAYHFLSSKPAQGGKEQADRFFAFVTLHGGFKPGDLPPAMDLEWDRACKTCDDRWVTNHRSAEEIIATSRDFLVRIKERTGRTPLLYTNKSFLVDHGITTGPQIARLTQGVKVWIFDLSESDRKLELPDPQKNLQHSLWQFSWGAKLNEGYTGDLDVDYFKGSAEDFKAAFMGVD